MENSELIKVFYGWIIGIGIFALVFYIKYLVEIYKDRKESKRFWKNFNG